MQALSPRELFESGARGAWSSELYRLPPHGSRPTRMMESRYYVHEENGCIDPHVLLPEDVSSESGNSSEEDDDISYPGFELSQNHCRSVCDGDVLAPPRRPTAATVKEWVTHNTPLLHEYAERQISPPLIDRVSTEFNHPTQFVKGALQMLSNRNEGSDESVHPTHRLEPQLLDGFVDIHNFANEYLRSQFGQELIGDLVPVLLTIITNNFYEAYMRLMDDIVTQALANMDARKGPCLEVKDFVFGFDLHMSQDMPFFVDVNHRVRDTLESLRPAKPPPATQSREPQTTRYGRTTKPTQTASEPETKKSRKIKTTTVKKAEQIDMAELASEPSTRHATPAPEPLSVSALGRLKKKPPMRARATPKPNPKHPEASTSSNVDRRPRQKATGRGKVPRYPQDSGHQASDPSPSMTMAGSSQMFTYSAARSQASTDGDVAQLRAASSEVKSAAPPLASNTVHDPGMAVVNVGEMFDGPPQSQGSASSAAYNHNPQLAAQLASWATDARLFEFITWPPMATSTIGQNTSQDVSCSQRPTSSTDSNAVDDTLSQIKSQPPQCSPNPYPKSEVVEDLEWNKGEEEPGVATVTSSAANALIGSQRHESVIDDAGDQDSPRTSSVVALPNNIGASEVGEEEEEEEEEEEKIEKVEEEEEVEEKSSLNTPFSLSTVITPELISTVAPTPTAFEEGQTPDTTTLAGYDSDATDATASTLVASFAPTPKIELQNLKSTQRTSCQRTTEPADDSSSSQRLTIKLPAQSQASTPSIAESFTPLLPSTTSTSVPLRRSLRARHPAIQIPAGSSSFPGSQSRAPSESVHQVLSPLSGVDAVTFTPELKARATKKRKLGRLPEG